MSITISISKIFLTSMAQSNDFSYHILKTIDGVSPHDHVISCRLCIEVGHPFSPKRKTHPSFVCYVGVTCEDPLLRCYASPIVKALVSGGKTFGLVRYRNST